ncbi:HEPN domain-containing protein [Candidatus Woesearchaeota archaeon]|nr:HEPN domain-containing protein [Candidatus Woesearchaeota archaeon]
MREFSFYLATNKVQRRQPDIHLARATCRESFDRLELAKSIASSEKPKYVLENAYEAVRELIDAILAYDGYKTYSHEASAAYLQELGFSITEATQADQLRIQRHEIKYKGSDATQQEAQAALAFAEAIVKKLVQMRPDITSKSKI